MKLYDNMIDVTMETLSGHEVRRSEYSPQGAWKCLENTEFIMNNTFWVGVYPGMTDDMIDYMAQVIEEAVNQ